VSNLEQFPDNYADDPTVAHILEQLRSDDPSPILVTGEAGTGKSTLGRLMLGGKRFIPFFASRSKLLMRTL